ncbi:hypothetical protein CDL12_10037 [Handroanthus impetiginosus]|uniref:Uncharacterized protein n=1 Tax=Handroanthus impetiginosus TaxID=429701 RepID=A0A2G9HID5_9LAMI|nr:hypothetical protein CDL12_10037 [Handroanthus impetiginosus]
MSQTQTSNEGLSNSNWRGSRIIRRVPEVLLREEGNRHDYIPKMVSIGPYHEGNPELLSAEVFKIIALERFREVHERENLLCYVFIKSKIPEIRNSYERGSTDRYSDGELTLMMLLDALFITVCMLEYIALEQGNIITAEYPSLRLENIARMRDHFGPLSISIAVRDMCLVDNQIPIWLVVLLLSTIVPAPGDAAKILHGYVSLVLFGELYSAKISFPEWTDESMLHLFDLFYGVLAVFVHEPVEETRSGHVNWCFGVQERTNADLESGDCCQGKCRLFNKAKGDLKILGHSFHSLTELKAKGIHLKPSPTQSLLDVKFKSNFMYSELQLPTLSTCLDTKTLFLNMMRYELDPQTLSPGVVISYINLMKLLIVKPEDVKELREKNILLGFQGSDEEIVKMYQDFDTQGVDNPGIYKDVKNRIQAHYNSKIKTWKAKLIHTYFHC